MTSKKNPKGAGRKKGSKSTTSIIKEKEAVELVINGNKTFKEAAKELGVHPQTVAERVQKALSSEDVRNIVERSRSRLTQMLSRCDDAYHRVLTYNHPDNFGNQIRVATGLYKTYGLVNEDPSITIQNNTAIQVKVDGKVYEFGSPE